MLFLSKCVLIFVGALCKYEKINNDGRFTIVSNLILCERRDSHLNHWIQMAQRAMNKGIQMKLEYSRHRLENSYHFCWWSVTKIWRFQEIMQLSVHSIINKIKPLFSHLMHNLFIVNQRTVVIFILVSCWFACFEANDQLEISSDCSKRQLQTALSPFIP